VSRAFEEGSVIIQYLFPVRNNVPQSLVYAYTDQNGNVIDLGNYVSVFVEIKQQDTIYSKLPAAFESQVDGLVACTYTFVGVGVWTVQFLCVDGGGNELFGEPIQITVVPNTEDLALSQLPNY
jgi:hypothetical protein